MAVLVTAPMKYAKCICCGSDKRTMYEFQFFQDIGCKTCVTLCGPCVHQMDNIVISKACDAYEEAHREHAARKHKVRK